jgi:lipoyl(octanoyl) transferase
MSTADERLPTYPTATWRLIVETEAHTGSWNMAVDESIMEAVAADRAPSTLRFYQWYPACVSLGKRQPLAGIEIDNCRRDGVDVVRRSTGGLAILHTDELTYSLITNADDPRATGAILDSYRQLSQGLVAGLRLLGVEVEMQPVSPGGSHSSSAACFEAPSAYEITSNGHKLMGSAQTRPHGKLLQHGSLPLWGDIGRLAEYLTFADDSERLVLAQHLRRRATTLGDILGQSVTFERTAAALAQGFQKALRLHLEPGVLTADELADASLLAETKRLVL